MKNLNCLNEYRVEFMGMTGDEYNGAFKIKIKGEEYNIIASNGLGWEHVSVSHPSKIPSWPTMCAVKDLFFNSEEVVMQLHPAQSHYINNHPNCLHLWKPLYNTIPTPPDWMVGI